MQSPIGPPTPPRPLSLPPLSPLFQYSQYRSLSHIVHSNRRVTFACHCQYRVCLRLSLSAPARETLISQSLGLSACQSELRVRVLSSVLTLCPQLTCPSVSICPGSNSKIRTRESQPVCFEYVAVSLSLSLSCPVPVPCVSSTVKLHLYLVCLCSCVSPCVVCVMSVFLNCLRT